MANEINETNAAGTNELADPKQKTRLEIPFPSLTRQMLQYLRACNTDAERGQLITAMLEYHFNGREIELTGKALAYFSLAKEFIDLERARVESIREIRRQAGAKGGAFIKTKLEKAAKYEKRINDESQRTRQRRESEKAERAAAAGSDAIKKRAK